MCLRYPGRTGIRPVDWACLQTLVARQLEASRPGEAALDALLSDPRAERLLAALEFRRGPDERVAEHDAAAAAGCAAAELAVEHDHGNIPLGQGQRGRQTRDARANDGDGAPCRKRRGG